MRKNFTTSNHSFLGSSPSLFLLLAIFIISTFSAKAQFITSPYQTANLSSQETTGSNQKSIRLNLQDASNKEEAVIVFDENGNKNAGFDDATFFEGSTVSLSTLSSDNIALAVNNMPNVEKVAEIKLNVNSNHSQKVTLSIEDLEAVKDFRVILKDTYSGDIIDLTSSKAYSFDIDKNNIASYGAERLKLQFIPETRNLAMSLLKYDEHKDNSIAYLPTEDNKEDKISEISSITSVSLGKMEDAYSKL